MTVALSGCLPSDLLKATSELGLAAQTVSSRLSGTTGIVTDLCRTEAQLDFLVHLAKDQTHYKSWAEYYNQAPLTEGPAREAGGRAPSWNAWCGGLRTVDAAFMKISLAIAAYGGALDRTAQTHTLGSTDIEGLTKSAADDVTQFVSWARPYKTALESVGSPLQQISNGLLTQWVGRKIKTVVDGADGPLQEALADLEGFVAVVQKELLFYANIYRENLALQGSKEPMAVAVVDMDVSQKLENVERDLASFLYGLKKLSAAHATLRRGWDAGCRVAQHSNAREVRELAFAILADARGLNIGGP
jgi:hypothetical protein